MSAEVMREHLGMLRAQIDERKALPGADGMFRRELIVADRAMVTALLETVIDLWDECAPVWDAETEEGVTLLSDEYIRELIAKRLAPPANEGDTQ